ncbi:MAG: alpha/beta hydrolase [Fibrella sp.]|nr:alpha/beta hydrolase [Armatimonadota bacterium]
MKTTCRFLPDLALAVVAAVSLLQVPSATRAAIEPVMRTAKAAPNQMFTTTPDGVRVAIQEYGDPKGPEIVLIHGLGGTHLDWMNQVRSPVLSKYRLVTYDLRGHGLSGKPAQAAYYADGKRWGDELRAVIEAKGLKRPVLVGWSLGGLVITNYLETHGDSRVAGIVYVDGVIELKPEYIKAKSEVVAALTSPDLATYLEGTRQFLRLCFYRQPDPETFALLYAGAAMASPDMIKQTFTGISVSAEATLPKVAVPSLFIYGERDALVDARTVERARQLMPKMKAILYPETGHAPFFEQPDRFNADLHRFAQEAEKNKSVTPPR